jgi:hypothetical protein
VPLFLRQLLLLGCQCLWSLNGFMLESLLIAPGSSRHPVAPDSVLGDGGLDLGLLQDELLLVPSLSMRNAILSCSSGAIG